MSHPIRRARFLPALTLLATLASISATPAAAQIFADDFETGTTFAWALSIGEPLVSAFLVDDLDLRDPHVFVQLPVGGCFDFTDQDLPLGLAPSLNSSLETAITTDGDEDGFLDESQMILFRPLDELSSAARVDFRDGRCTAPLVSTSCIPEPGSVITTLDYQGQDSGVCLGPVPASTSGYVPAVGETLAPCFSTESYDASFALGDIALVLEDVQQAAGFLGDPTSSLTDGLIRGFLSETAADAILLPADIPLVGGQPLSILLKGGTGNCAAGDDREMYDGVLGWWFYLEFSAQEMPYSDG